MHKQEFIITVGIPASGKSTWAKEYAEECGNTGRSTFISERDAIRTVHFTHSMDINDYKFSKSKEQQVTEIQEAGIIESLNAGDSVIVTDTNLNEDTRNRLIKLSREHGLEPIIKTFDTPLRDCIQRNYKRHHTVPEHVLINMEKKMRQYLGKSYYNGSEAGLPNCIIVDIDGTLASHKGIRSPFEWDRVKDDDPIWTNIDLVEGYSTYEDNPPWIFIFSGRDSVCRRDTEEWLDEFVTYDALHMRPEGNTENDCIIKERMYNEYIHGKYNVSFVMDDRKNVVDLWASMGLNVVDVGNRLFF